MLFFLKTLHLFIWLLVAAAIFYILYAGLTNQFNLWLLLSYLIISAEGIILIAYKWNCPLSKIARRYTNNKKENFDIHLPLLIAKHHRKFLIIVFVIGTILVLFNIFNLYQK